MNPGTLDRRVVLENYAVGRSVGWNHPEKTWGTLATVWAMKREHLGTERLESAQVLELRRTTFRIRYRTDVDTSMRVKDGSDYYYIVGIRELGRGHMLELMTELRT